MKPLKIVLLFALVMFLQGQAFADSDWPGIQKPYELYGHLWNTDDCTATGNSTPYCAPTATMNSFIYLENKYPEIYDNLLTPGDGINDECEAREALRMMMGGCAGGATDKQWWEGKVQYINIFAPETTIFDGMILTPDDVLTWLQGGVLENAYPTWDFLYTELAKCEDVEIKICPIQGSSDCHALTLTSLTFDDTNLDGMWSFGEARKIDYLDPNNPTQLFESLLSIGPGGRFEFTWNNGGANPDTSVYLAGAFCESPIPEPAMLSLLAIGMGGLLVLRMRRVT